MTLTEKCNQIALYDLDNGKVIKYCSTTFDDCKKHKYYEQYYCPFVVRKV